MIDMHMHTLYSDGDKTVEEILKMCEEKKLTHIAITDHNTTKQYQDPALNKNLFSGKIIKGVEMNATFHGKNIEVLAYNIKELSVIENWSQQFFSETALRQRQEETKTILLSVCDKKGLIYDLDQIKTDISPTDYITIYIYQELLRHKENYPILGELAESTSAFVRKGLLNPESDYYTGKTNLPKPHYTDVVDIIHKAGGLAFLAHPFEYRFDDTLGFIDSLREERELDGIECFHPSANSDKMHLLENYAHIHHLYISGGSDYHGHKKPEISVGVGSGNLHISESYLEQWINL